jgi:hypothetical protein
LALDLEPWERCHVEGRIRTLGLEYGAALSRAGEHRESLRVHRGSLSRRTTVRGVLGMLKAVIRSCGR